MKKVLTVILICLAGIVNADSWTQLTGFTGTARIEPCSFSIGNNGYIGCGYDQVYGHFLKDFWEYNSITDTWTQKADFGPGGRRGAVGFSINDKGYIGTGWDSLLNLHNDFWE
jgi:N-acetylneuraminic acid mutarotase